MRDALLGLEAKDFDIEVYGLSYDALAAFLATKPGARPERLAKSYDDWGLDVDYIRAWGWWFAFLRNIYWRIESEGMENIPASGKGLFVSNHRGFMPLDAVMHLSLIFTLRNRVPRFLIIHSLLRTPFLSNSPREISMNCALGSSELTGKASWRRPTRASAAPSGHRQ